MFCSSTISQEAVRRKDERKEGAGVGNEFSTLSFFNVFSVSQFHPSVKPHHNLLVCEEVLQALKNDAFHERAGRWKEGDWREGKKARRKAAPKTGGADGGRLIVFLGTDTGSRRRKRGQVTEMRRSRDEQSSFLPTSISHQRPSQERMTDPRQARLIIPYNHSHSTVQMQFFCFCLCCVRDSQVKRLKISI